MKRSIVVLTLLPLLVLALAGTSYSWQGRMGGMGDPYGLVADESDFLIHPAKIAKGEGVRFYGDYRFTYTSVMDWKYNLDEFDTTGTVLTDFFHYDTSGQEYKHNALVGAAFPLGPGRMGLLFEYAGKRGDYDGDEDILGTSNYAEYDLTNGLDNFALRVLYGLPLGGFNLGGEAQFAYRQEENENWIQWTSLGQGRLNELFGWDRPRENLLPFQFPYDSRYWEALFKGSLEGMVGLLDLEFTLRGGFVFGGDNSLLMEREVPVGTLEAHADLDGDVQGWRLGGDLWARYPVGDGLTLPFLVRIDYQTKTRDGDGPGTLYWSPWYVNYESEERGLQLTAGGGVDKELGAGTKIAAGIYYNYLQGEKNIKALFTPDYAYDSSDYPASTEHQVMIRLAGEHEFFPVFALRMGLGFFYGWVSEDFTFTNYGPTYADTDDIALNGYRWGIGGSLGGAIKLKPITLEPFIAGGYEVLNLNCNGRRTQYDGTVLNLWNMTQDQGAWYLGTGFSVLFDL